MQNWNQMDDDMEMPTPCQHCGNWFDLNDGTTSTKWYPDTIICQKCGDKEEIEIERDEEIEDLKMSIEDAEYTLKEARKRLMELGVHLDPKPGNTIVGQKLQDKADTLVDEKLVNAFLNVNLSGMPEAERQIKLQNLADDVLNQEI